MTNHQQRKTESVALVTFVVTFAIALCWLLYGSGIRAEFDLERLQENMEQGQNECQEDEPCWDCETMGNMICGPNHSD